MFIQIEADFRGIEIYSGKFSQKGVIDAVVISK